MKPNKNLLIFFLILAACFLFLSLWLYLRQRGSSQTVAVIEYQGEVLRTVDLSQVTKTEEFVVGPENAENTIRISPEGIQVIQANCPDQVCVHQGRRSHGPEPIVCLPHKLVIRFSQPDASSSDGLDAVTGR